MARLSRAEIFDPSEIVAVDTMARTNRRCFLMGDDPFTGKNFDHRKRWIEDKLKHLAANFGIDLLAFSCLSNHFHLVLRSRPDVVKTWDDTEVARRWWWGERDTACLRVGSCKSVLEREKGTQHVSGWVVANRVWIPYFDCRYLSSALSTE